MSTPPTHPVPAAAGLSSAVRPEPRATFGWRPGSIRGLLSLMVLGLLWSIVLFSKEWKQNQQVPLIYVYLLYLLVLIIAYYFPAYGSTGTTHPGERRALRLWPEIVPWVLVIGTIGLGLWVYYTLRQLGIGDQIYLNLPLTMLGTIPLLLLGGFLIGHALSWVVGKVSGGYLPAWFQDMQAWVALLGMVGLAVEMLLQLFVLTDPGQREQLRQAMEQWGGLLAGLVSFYFGARTETPRVSHSRLVRG